MGRDGYKSLACAIIERAVGDALKVCTTVDHRRDKKDAIDFLMTDRLDTHISFYGLDLNPDYVRKAIKGKEK